LMIMQTRGILLNYEGTIDTNGQHWGAILWHKFQKHVIGLDKPVFNRAYAYSENVLASDEAINPGSAFLDVLVSKITERFNCLEDAGYEVDYSQMRTMAEECNQLAQRTLKKTKNILESLADTFPFVLVSNFYGNLNAVLTAFAIRHYFSDVIESR